MVLVYHSFPWSRDWNRARRLVGSNGNGADPDRPVPVLLRCDRRSPDTSGRIHASVEFLAADFGFPAGSADFTGILFLWLYGGYSATVSVSCALTMAVAGTIVELFSPSEWDTVTVPVTMLAIALIMLTKN